MFSMQTLGSAASFLILQTQTPLLHTDSNSVKSQSFCFSFMFDWSCVPLALHLHLRAFARQFVASLPSRVHGCSLASWHQASGMETTGRMGGSTELQLKAGLRTCAKGFLPSQRQIWPITPDSRAVKWLHMFKPQKPRPEKSHAEPGYQTGLDWIFSCHPQHH